MAHACPIIPKVYIDKVFLGNASLSTSGDGEVTVNTGDIIVNLKFTQLIEADLVNNLMEFPNSDINIQDYVKIVCMLSTSQEVTDVIKEGLDPQNRYEGGWPAPWTFNQYNMRGPTTWDGSAYWTPFALGDPLLKPGAHGLRAGQFDSDPIGSQYYAEIHSVDEFTCTPDITYQDEPFVANGVYRFGSFRNNANFESLTHLTCFAYVVIDTDQLETDYSISLPSQYKYFTTGYYVQERIIEGGDVAPKFFVKMDSGDTTSDADPQDKADHSHTYQIDANGNGITDTVTISADPRYDHFHEIKNYAVFLSHNHVHEINEDALSVTNTIDYRIQAELDALHTSLAGMGTRLLAEEEAVYFSDMWLTKDASRNARYAFTFDYGKFILNESDDRDFISNMSITAKQQIISNSIITKFILSRHQVGPGGIDVPVVEDLDDPALTEIGLELMSQSYPSGNGQSYSLLRHFTGIDAPAGLTFGEPRVGMADLTSGEYQYILDIEVVDGFASMIALILKPLVEAFANYQEYYNTAMLPLPSELCEHFTLKGVKNLDKPLSQIATDTIIAYLDALGALFDGFDSQSSHYAYYQSKLQTMVYPKTGTQEGVALLNQMMLDLVGIYDNLLRKNSSGTSVEVTAADIQSNNLALHDNAPVITMRYEFNNYIDALFENDMYVDNVSLSLSDVIPGLKVYTIPQLLSATSTGVSDANPTVEDQTSSDGYSATTDSTDTTSTSDDALTREEADAAADEHWNAASAATLATDEGGAAISLSSAAANALSSYTGQQATTWTVDKGGTTSSIFSMGNYFGGAVAKVNPIFKAAVTTNGDSTAVDLFTSDPQPASTLMNEVEVLMKYNIATPQPPTTLGGIQLKSDDWAVKRFEELNVASCTGPVTTRCYYLCRQSEPSGWKWGEIINRYFLLVAPQIPWAPATPKKEKNWGVVDEIDKDSTSWNQKGAIEQLNQQREEESENSQSNGKGIGKSDSKSGGKSIDKGIGKSDSKSGGGGNGYGYADYGGGGGYGGKD